MDKAPRDLLLFLAFSVLPIASFKLLGVPDTDFYLTLFLVSGLVIVWIRHYYREPQQLVDYDENLSFEGILFILAAVGGIMVAAALLVQGFTRSVLYVPTANMEMAVGQFQLSGFWNDVLFQLVLVGPSEECIKLAVHLAFYIWLVPLLGKSTSRIIAITGPILFWALLHTYRNPTYTGALMVPMVAAAFVGGLIIFAVMYYTKSLLAAILTHAAYNIVILYIQHFMLAA